MKNSKTIIYIHGFNSGPGNKSIKLKELGFEVVTPQLNHKNALEDLKQIRTLIDNELLQEKQISIVGTSLGGFYAMVLKAYYPNNNFISHCINPSYKPYENLKKVKGQELKNYKTGAKYILQQEFLDSLKTEFDKYQNIVSKNVIAKTYLYLGLNDEVVNFDEIKTVFSNIWESEQDHRFADISLIIENLQK